MTGTPYERLRAFIVTPFGRKADAQGRLIDFDAVGRDLIGPALDRLGLRGRTTGEIVRAGNIHADMFQRLLTADLVVAEVSIHNANVFYELGIRHALRPHGTVLLRGEGDAFPFDLQTYRYLTYDPARPAASVDALAATLRATLDSAEQDSPVFRSLPGLSEQEYRSFLPVPVEFREEVERAQALGHRADLDLLGMETVGFEWGGEGLRVVGRAQFKLDDRPAARDTWEKIREDHPDDKEACTLLSTLYERLHDLTRSDQMVQRLLANPETTPYERAEAYALMGRNAKTRWIAEWRGDAAQPRPPAEWAVEALRSGFLAESFELCQKGFGEDLNHFYSGLNALAMLKVRLELAAQLPEVWAERFDDDAAATTALAALGRRFDELAPSVALSIRAGQERLKREAEAATDGTERDRKRDELRWARISEADHRCLTSGRAAQVRAGYRDSLGDVLAFYGDSVAKQLVLYRDLGILRDNVAAALEVAEEQPATKASEPPHVLVFTGHRIDDAGREAKGLAPRFPKGMEATARAAIKQAVEREQGQAGGSLLGIAGGASGGDILFHEVCEDLGIPTLLYLALPRDPFVEASVRGAGPEWVRRFDRLHATRPRRELSSSAELPRWLRDKPGYSLWQRNNLWILSHALAQAGGGGRVTLIALWNGQEGDGPGGTGDMVAQARQRGARAIVLGTEELFGLGGGKG